jgi:ATP-dependent DNA ligase
MLMLAKTLEKLEDLDGSRVWTIQSKLDGMRYQLFLFKDGRVELKGRHSSKLMNDIYPEVTEEAQSIAKGLAEDVSLDGEMICGSKNGFWYMNSLSLMQSREHSRGRMKISLLRKYVPATFVVFDIISPSTKDLILVERLDRLNAFLYNRGQRIQAIESQTGRQQKIDVLFEEAKKLGLEGLMLKNPDSKYIEGRSNDWLKLKVWREEDTEATGYASKTRRVSALITPKGKVNFVGQSEEIEAMILKRDLWGTRTTSDEVEYIFTKPVKIKLKYLPSQQEQMRSPVLKSVEI